MCGDKSQHGCRGQRRGRPSLSPDNLFYICICFNFTSAYYEIHIYLNGSIYIYIYIFSVDMLYCGQLDVQKAILADVQRRLGPMKTVPQRASSLLAPVSGLPRCYQLRKKILLYDFFLNI